MGKLSKEAFVVMGACPVDKRPFGITVDPRGRRHYAFCWAFKMKPGQDKREGYGKKKVTGSIDFDPDYQGCPYCGALAFYICGNCGRVVCYHNEEVVTCPHCGYSGGVAAADSFNLQGGDM